MMRLSSGPTQALVALKKMIGSLGGYWLGELPGLIVGVAIGALAGYVSLGISMARHGLSTARSDIGYSLATLAVAGVGAYGPVWLAEQHEAQARAEELVGPVEDAGLAGDLDGG